MKWHSSNLINHAHASKVALPKPAAILFALTASRKDRHLDPASRMSFLTHSRLSHFKVESPPRFP